ncbi:L-seryl-tRNA(Sec) selenium transferase [Acetonema longum]|uniref:L-seryl-tRNA(Sec) selenium transferase n=1 Tax=Acetonema longum DSM 6540 TaxID=1009370 RepID=F7NIF6_9FIRM|nr:L-seryl-tRNA(Sec) selenium transferase [Acetonema longum]EGO64186.1 selenocysteine synthase [Acetonema longum DSM 6540]
MSQTFRVLPSIDKLLHHFQEQPEAAAYPRSLLADVLRETLEHLREQIRTGREIDPTPAGILAAAVKRLDQMASPGLRKVINATGTILHTNLGRAPLSRQARTRVEEVMDGYSTLEYNAAAGKRGSRYDHVAQRLCRLTGAEDALVVNNNAAAVLLVLSAIVPGREVIVSRGQLVEIGGSFRIPAVLAQSGAKLVEVGTTNKTRLSDYHKAITPDTGAILKVHTSNFRIIGFVEQPEDEELSRLARAHDFPLIEDAGSGTLLPLKLGDWQEPSLRQRLAAGMDIVTASGDKLLGGGQAGIILGQKRWLAPMKSHPLLRALRVDKLTLAALEGTLLDYEMGNPLEQVPVLSMLHQFPQQLEAKAHRLAALFDDLRQYGWHVQVLALTSQVGGGSFPGVEIAGWGVQVRWTQSAQKLETRLRLGSVPVIVRIEDDAVIFDVRCLDEPDLVTLAAICGKIVKGEQV